MTTIVQTAPNATTLTKPLTETTLNGTADNIPFVRGSGQFLMLRNPTGVTVNNVRLFGTTAGLAGFPGSLPVDHALGFLFGSVATLQTRFVRLDDIYQYLSGVASVSNGSTLIATLVAND